jgi:hypothetical protein
MRSILIRPCLLALGACLVLGACGRQAATGGAGSRNAGPAPGAAAPLDACDLLAPEDIRRVSSEVSGSLSSTLDDAVGRDPSQCVFTLGSNLPPRVISVQVRQAESAERAATLHHAAETGLGSLAGGTRAEPGLGDAAFWVGGQLDQLHVLDGNRQLILTVQIDKDPEGAARALAAKALARLRAGPRRPPPRPAGR